MVGCSHVSGLLTRPVIAAGPNAIRGIGSQSQARARSALTQAGFPDPRYDGSCITSRSPCQALQLLWFVCALNPPQRLRAFDRIATAQQRPGDARELVGQRHRGNLGRLAGDEFGQPRVRGSGQPDECPGRNSPLSRLGPDPRIPSGPAVQNTAPTGRTQDCTRPNRRTNKTLATRKPSTQDI